MKLRDEETQILYEFTISDQGEYVVEPIDEDQSNWHPHHDLIVAWARSAPIQFFERDQERWMDFGLSKMAWNPNIKFRIKPDNSEEIAKAEKDLRWLENEVNDLKRKLAKLRG